MKADWSIHQQFKNQKYFVKHIYLDCFNLCSQTVLSSLRVQYGRIRSMLGPKVSRSLELVKAGVLAEQASTLLSLCVVEVHQT